jgi:muconate cycloisomerase
VGVEPVRDVEMVRRVRAAVGPGVALSVDANEGYKTPGEAIKTIRKMEAYDLIYAEQPVHGIARMAQVAQAIDTPVMADESAWNSHDVIDIIERRAAQIVSIYTTKPGGLYRAMEVAAVCRAAGIICNVNGSAELGVGSLANVALAAAAQAVTLPSVFPVSTPASAQHGQVGGIYYKDDIIVAALDISDGAIRIPMGPGLGIDVDLEKIEKYRVTD